MRLIREEINQFETLIEGSGDEKKLFLEGVFMQGVPNKNGRVYPMGTLSKKVNEYITERVDQGRAWGELDHPKGPKINADRISHRITSLNIEGTNVIGKARVIDENPPGRIVKGLIESGGQIGMSSRGLGSLKKLDNGLLEVQEDFKIITAADVVMDPSAPDAFVEGVMENVDWIYNNGEWVAQEAQMIKESVKKMSKRQLEGCKYRLFEAFLDKVSKRK